MNDKDRQFLTEWGGECWHEKEVKWHPSCKKCKEEFPAPNRTFTTPDDAQWLKEKLVEKRKWFNFKCWLWDTLGYRLDGAITIWIEFADILTTPFLFCEKVKKFLEGTRQ